MSNDNIQRYIVRQSCLNRATDILCAQMSYDKAVQEVDYGTLKTLVYGLAQDFESWVFRGELNGNTSPEPVKKAGLRRV